MDCPNDNTKMYNIKSLVFMPVFLKGLPYIINLNVISKPNAKSLC